MKKIFILALAAIIATSAVTFSGCGEKDNTGADDETSVSVKSTEDEAATNATDASGESTSPSSVATTAPSAGTTQPAASTDKKQSTNNSNNSTRSSSGTNTSSGSKTVTSVSLSKGNITISEGSSASFEVYINPESATDRQYNVTTSNGNATVSCNGSTVTVYAQNRGNCTITVSSTNGKSAVCNVTVTSSSGGSGNGSGGNSNGGSNRNSGGNGGGSVTDDTLLPRNQLITKANMDKLVNSINNHFSGKGATYTSSLNKNNSGWFISDTSSMYQGDYYYSVNSMISSEIECFEDELYGLFVSNPQMDINRRYEIRFRCYYEQLGQNDFDVYFCYG